MKVRLLIAAGVVLACASATPVSAQFGGALKGLGKKAIDKAKEEPKPAPKPTESTSETTPPESKPAAEKPAAEEPAAASGTAAVDANGQPEMKDVKIDFVPGEKTVFLDDFSDMAPDEPPPHWKVRGDAVTLRTAAGGLRDLSFPGSSTLTSGKVSIPKNFTLEITLSPTPEYQKFTKWRFMTAKDEIMMEVNIESGGDGYKNAPVSVTVNGEHIGDGSPQLDLHKPINVAVWMQQGRLRAYENGERILDANQVEIPEPIDHIVLEAGFGKGFIAVRSVRIAESTPDFSTVIGSTGKYVSHGIHFDTDSDRLLADSAPVLKMVAGALSKNPSLKLAINGYTDSTGNADHNLDLSKRRAAAVKSVLVTQFAVDAGRLTSGGFGAAQPLGSNDTPQGRADNRRVEFVKQ